jgi:hypothetical protein
MTKYTLTDEHRAQLKPWADKWVRNAMSTEPMTDEDRRIVREAITGLYVAADLEPPPLHRIVFVPSPFVAAFAAGFAADIWAKRAATRDATSAATLAATSAATLAATAAATRDATYAATRDATAAATYAATRDATSAATRDATYAATYPANAATAATTYAATRDATYAATRDATSAATYYATRDATVDATADATAAATLHATDAATLAATRAATSAATDATTDAATYAATLAATCADDDLTRWYVCQLSQVADLARQHGWSCTAASEAWRMRDGGNQWSWWAAFVSFFRHVVRLELDYSKWQHYETAAIHSGPRYMHAQFCLVSDRPERLLVDELNRPHCDDGPFCRWRDGSALYAIHGTRVPAYVVLHPETITIDKIQREPNVEVRRIMVDRYGMGRYLQDTHAEVVDADYEGCTVGAAPRVLISSDVGRFLVGTDGGTQRTYYMQVPEDVTTCRAAHEALCGFSESKIKQKS